MVSVVYLRSTSHVHDTPPAIFHAKFRICVLVCICVASLNYFNLHPFLHEGRCRLSITCCFLVRILFSDHSLTTIFALGKNIITLL